MNLDLRRHAWHILKRSLRLTSRQRPTLFKFVRVIRKVKQ